VALNTRNEYATFMVLLHWLRSVGAGVVLRWYEDGGRKEKLRHYFIKVGDEGDGEDEEEEE
jgi:hypothetical protein